MQRLVQPTIIVQSFVVNFQNFNFHSLSLFLFSFSNHNTETRLKVIFNLHFLIDSEFLTCTDVDFDLHRRESSLAVSYLPSAFGIFDQQKYLICTTVNY